MLIFHFHWSYGTPAGETNNYSCSSRKKFHVSTVRLGDASLCAVTKMALQKETVSTFTVPGTVILDQLENSHHAKGN
jgi:hypothetical protein